MTLPRAALGLLALACTPPSQDLTLDTGDRHFSTGLVYQLEDDACTTPVDEPAYADRQRIDVRNDYLETAVEVVRVAPDCETTPLATVPPQTTGTVEVEIPAVLGIELADGTRLSTWSSWVPGGGGTIVVQP